MICKKCGNNVKSDFKYCPYCGERVISDFHDHYEELTPPFVIHDLSDEDEEDDAAAFYAPDPAEPEPDFEGPAQPYPARLPSEESEEAFAPEQPQAPEYPERPEAFRRPERPYAPEQAYPPERPYAWRPATREEPPYFIYHPEDVPPGGKDVVREREARQPEDYWRDTPEQIAPNARYQPRRERQWEAADDVPVTARREQTPAGTWEEPPYGQVPPSGSYEDWEDEPPRGPGMGARLLAVFLTLALAAAVSIFGYRALVANNSPGEGAPNPEVEAMFACILEAGGPRLS